jgi:hypothetical protein
MQLNITFSRDRLDLTSIVQTSLSDLYYHRPITMLCHACTQLFAGHAQGVSRRDWDGLYKMHHPDFASLRRATEVSCKICSKLRRKFTTDYQGREVIREDMLITSTALPYRLSPSRTMNVL